MPEKLIYKLLEREIRWEEHKVPVAVSRANHEAFFGASFCFCESRPMGSNSFEFITGEFITHPECCARVNGTRQTFTLHVSPPTDPNFVQLPVSYPPPKIPAPKSQNALPPHPYYCGPCHGPQGKEVSDTPDDIVEASPSLFLSVRSYNNVS